MYSHILLFTWHILYVHIMCINMYYLFVQGNEYNIYADIMDTVIDISQTIQKLHLTLHMYPLVI